MPAFSEAKLALQREPKTWLVTGAAGFIGSHLVEALLNLDQRVVGLDNFSAGKRENLEQIRNSIKPVRWSAFSFIEGDIRDSERCRAACANANFVLHQAAQCSVAGSMADPLLTHEVNVTGFLNLLWAARAAGVKRCVYASSCAVYGDSSEVPSVEERVGNALSPYALSKQIDELYSGIFARSYQFPSVGLRYYNVFGPRQDPNGAYAAVIPRWITALLRNQQPIIYGDGEATRDFCFVEDIVQANLLAATATSTDALNHVYNVGRNESTSLSVLYGLIQQKLQRSKINPSYQNPRSGDIRVSRGDISRARRLLGYEPAVTLSDGLDRTIAWYQKVCQ